jgi:gamma-butyrobetaine dioxygenase
MNENTSYLYHHSAKFRNIKLGQVSSKIDKFYGTQKQLDDIEKFKKDSLDLFDKSKEFKISYPLKNMDVLNVVNYEERNAKNVFINNILEYGFCVVDTNIIDIDKVINWIIPNEHPMSTMYGLVWDVIDKKDDAINLAYTNKGIELHQDLVYYSPPPTIQVLYCLEQAEKGGTTTFLNVYKLALEFKIKYPKEFDILKKYKTTFQKVHYERDTPYHIIKKIEIMEHNENNELIRVNWSPVFEGFTNYKEDGWSDYYNAYFVWDKFINNQKKINILLKPGQFVAFHNHHMLHGRDEYIGDRHLKGFYLSNEQWENKVNLFMLQK